MILSGIIALLRAKNGKPWVWYIVGVVFSVFSYFGQYTQYNTFGDAVPFTLTLDIILFVIIAIVFLIFISLKIHR